MKQGYLSQYFKGVAAKTLSQVEADPAKSNQHEFNGVAELKHVLGEPPSKVRYATRFIYLTDDAEAIHDNAFMTWYDARRRARIERGVMRYEHRLYFPTNEVSLRANEGDILVIARLSDDSLLAIIIEAGTTIASQVLWLFGLNNVEHPGFSIREELESEQDRIAFAATLVLETIGVEVHVPEDTWLDRILEKFGQAFPTTREFSAFSRSTLSDISAASAPDDALLAWLEREEILFRTLEKHLIGERLSNGFDGDVDGFIAFSLSVHNRRKSRAGLALENHLELIFAECGVAYSRTPTTEGKSKPDFIFPSIRDYQSKDFSPNNLTMLGVKSTCKDRWRQVLTEAERIDQKHLLTLEAAISVNQTNEMSSTGVQLVVPRQMHSSYQPKQVDWLWSVGDFIDHVRAKQLAQIIT